MKKRHVFLLGGTIISAALLWSIKKPDDSEIFTKTLDEESKRLKLSIKALMM